MQSMLNAIHCSLLGPKYDLNDVKLGSSVSVENNNLRKRLKNWDRGLIQIHSDPLGFPPPSLDGFGFIEAC